MKKKLLETHKKSNNIKPLLFESFCGDESEFGVCKDDILDWLTEHKQLWDDCENHFGEDPNRLSADELEGFICDHDTAFEDYCRWFEVDLDESLKEELNDADMDDCLRLITDIIYKYYINDLSKENLKDLLGRLESELCDSIDFIDQMRAENEAEDISESKKLKEGILDEALPKDLMRQMRGGTENGPRGRMFNYSDDYSGYWDRDSNTPVYDKSKSRVIDYQNATYKEATPEEILRMKKNGESLNNVYIMKDGKLLALDREGKPDDRRSTTYARANQSLKKSVENADKIYIVDAKDAAVTQPDKMASRLRNREVRDANYNLGHSAKSSSYSGASRKDTSYSVYANEFNQSVAQARKAYEDGRISRNDMEQDIERAKKRFASYRDWTSSEYQDVRNKNAEYRYKDSELTLQKPFRDLRIYRSELSDAKRYLDDAKSDLQAAQTGQSSGRWNEKSEYAEAKAEVEKLTQQIANLQKHLARYQAIIDGGAQDKDIKAANDRIAKYSSQVQDTQAKIDKLLRR